MAIARPQSASRELPTRTSRLSDEAIEQITAALEGLRFGAIEVVVHEGHVVQVERRSRVRVPIESKEERTKQQPQ